MHHRCSFSLRTTAKTEMRGSDSGNTLSICCRTVFCSCDPFSRNSSSSAWYSGLCMYRKISRQEWIAINVPVRPTPALHLLVMEHWLPAVDKNRRGWCAFLSLDKRNLQQLLEVLPVLLFYDLVVLPLQKLSRTLSTKEIDTWSKRISFSSRDSWSIILKTRAFILGVR